MTFSESQVKFCWEGILGKAMEITFSAFLRVQPYQSMRWFEFDCSIMFDQARFFSPSRAVPAVTFYRDSSAQCPNCQAVWLLLAARICKTWDAQNLSPQAEVGLNIFSLFGKPQKDGVAVSCRVRSNPPWAPDEPSGFPENVTLPLRKWKTLITWWSKKTFAPTVKSLPLS